MSLKAMVGSVAMVLLSVLLPAEAWNHTETTELGWLAQGGTTTQTGIVLNWRSDNTQSLQSFYATVPANSILEIDVSCPSAWSGTLYVQAVPNTIGFYSSMTTPSGWTRVGSMKIGSSFQNVQVHLHYVKSQWASGAYAVTANLRLTCKAVSGTSSSYSSVTGSGIVPSGKKKVIFNANGGTGGKTMYVKNGKKIGSLPKPKRVGYKFKGWYTKKSGGTKVSTSTKIKKNVTYYARWTANKYKIKFNANGGNGSMATVSATYGKSIKLKGNGFKKANNKFLGWSTSKTGSVAYTNKAKVKNLTASNGKTVTLYAVWSRSSGGSSTSSGGSSSSASGSSSSGAGYSTAYMREFWMNEYRKWLRKADDQKARIVSAQTELDRKIASGGAYSIALLRVQSEKDLYNTYLKNANNAYKEAMKY